MLCDKTMEFPRDISHTFSSINFFENFDKSNFSSSLEYYVPGNFNVLTNKFWLFGFGLKCKNWIYNPNSKSKFDFGLSISFQSNKLDCNPDCNNPIQQYPVNILVEKIDSHRSNFNTRVPSTLPSKLKRSFVLLTKNRFLVLKK